MKKGFTIIELLVAMGLLAAVIAAAGMIFNYSLESQRTASATAEIMRTLRAITEQLDIDLGFKGLQPDGYLILYSENVSASDTNNLDALYYFSTGDYQSWPSLSMPTPIRSNIARIFLYHDMNMPGDLGRDVLLLNTANPRTATSDYTDISFEQCQTSPDTATLFSSSVLNEPPNVSVVQLRPDARAFDYRSLFAQNVGSFKVEWTDGTITNNLINWYGLANHKNLAFETPGPPYLATWTPSNTNQWPRALKFTFTLYDSKKILKGGRTFEYIVYLGQ